MFFNSKVKCFKESKFTKKHSRSQSIIDFPFGGHVNVLSDYKEIVPAKKGKFLQSQGSHYANYTMPKTRHYTDDTS